ncbi:CDGSH iron-sulfur domain-containing protein [Streptomyces sedi]|uniref:CDGSH iron-sulfur domain-containing protein n=1 Tax=Streptomyces sedi TaxID=555059 RepID=A0A5C4UWJ4_9ACTN|nr:CDGSH iron-sulfur domain-containing protein [Streptomyces sedi]
MVAEREGPLLVEGPVEVVLDDGRVVRGDRFLVALCTCRRSRRYPWCDTSHRRRARGERRDGSGDVAPGDAAGGATSDNAASSAASSAANDAADSAARDDAEGDR